MTDLATRLRDVERTEPPDLWPEIGTRTPRAMPRERHSGRVLAAAVAVAVVVAGIVTPLTLLRSGDVRGPGGPGGPGLEGHRFQSVIEPSEAMVPTIPVGAVVTIDLDAFDDVSPRTGDIIAFVLPQYINHVFLSRVIGLPGDTVLEEKGVVYLNGTVMDEPYVNTDPRDTRTLGPWRVQRGYLFVMGDNRDNANDSRFGLGQVPIEDVLGRVVGINSGVGGSPSPPPPAGAATGPTGSSS